MRHLTADAPHRVLHLIIRQEPRGVNVQICNSCAETALLRPRWSEPANIGMLLVQHHRQVDACRAYEADKVLVTGAGRHGHAARRRRDGVAALDGVSVYAPAGKPTVEVSRLSSQPSFRLWLPTHPGL